MAAGEEEGCICGGETGLVATIDETSLKGIGIPIVRSTLGVIMFELS